MAFEEAELSAFLSSMPPDYRAAFDVEAARAHEAIVKRRGHRTSHVEIWRELSERLVGICVVADDKPGLLSCITAALVESAFDVVSAHAYCRTREDGSVEAVDLLWIRRLPDSNGFTPPILAGHIMALADTIARAARASASDLVEPSASERVSAPSAPPEPLAVPASTCVRFETNADDGATILMVEAVDRPGLLLAVTQALFRAGLQIIGLHATTERGCAVDRFTLAEVEGTPLSRERRLTLQTAILGAIDGALAGLRHPIG